MWWQSLKCLLSGSLQKWFATHDVESTSELASLSTKSHCQCMGADPAGLSSPSTYSLPCRTFKCSEFRNSEMKFRISFSTPNDIST